MIIPSDSRATINDLLNTKEASAWASAYLGQVVTAANISYLIRYGRIAKVVEHGSTQVSKQELTNYYQSYNKQREARWKEK